MKRDGSIQINLNVDLSSGENPYEVADRVRAFLKALEPEKKKESGEQPELTITPRIHPLMEIWNTHCGSLPKIAGCTASRLAKARQRWAENPSPAYWIDVVTRIAASNFCTGNNDRGWKANFDFLIRPETQHRIIEGQYSGKSKPGVNLVPVTIEDVL